MQSLSEQNILLFLIQVFLLLGLARILGELFRTWKQPSITAEILAGVLLGPTIFGRFFPALHLKIFPATIIQENMLETVAWLGLLFFLLEALSSAVIKRENSMGTAIEEGIALPHARIPALIRPVVVFSRSEFGIDWDSPDGESSHFIFLILTPREDDDIQIQILRIIARAMSGKKTQRVLMAATDQQGIWQALQ